MKTKPVIGQIVYAVNVGNAARHRKQSITEMTVLKVGRKYFECKEPARHFSQQFSIDGWHQNHGGSSANTELYESPQEWADEKEHYRLSTQLRDLFSRYGKCPLTLDQLKRITDITKEGK